MCDGANKEFGHAPICPKGFTPDYKVEAIKEERSHYRQLWKGAVKFAEDMEGDIDRLVAEKQAEVLESAATQLPRSHPVATSMRDQAADLRRKAKGES